MGADLIEHADGEFSRAVFVKGGSGDPSTLIGTVDSIAAGPTFTVASLSGHGDDYFDSWYAYVVWDKDGAAAAPQGESQAITGYTSATGVFAHAAFGAALVAGDKVLISLTDPNAATGGGTATIANQQTIIAEVTNLDGDAMRGTDLAALAATALSDVVWTNAKAAFLNAAIGDIPTVMVGTDSAALASVCTETRLAHLTQDVTVGIKKNVERTIVFKMVDATDFATPEPSITVTEERSLDGAAFAACTNAATEVGGAGNGCGWYKITLTAAEMNASEIIFKGTAAGCAQCDRLIVTES